MILSNQTPTRVNITWKLVLAWDPKTCIDWYKRLKDVGVGDVGPLDLLTDATLEEACWRRND